MPTKSDQLNLASGLRSTSETYFNKTDESENFDLDYKLFSVPDKDLKTYRNYAAVADNAMELHHELQQRSWSSSLKQQKSPQITPKIPANSSSQFQAPRRGIVYVLMELYMIFRWFWSSYYIYTI